MVIDWEIYEKLKFDHTDRWYMQNQSAVLENDNHHLLQADHLISARRTDFIIFNKKKTKKKKKNRTSKVVDFAVPVDHRIKLKESDENDKYVDVARELKKKTMEHDDDNYTNRDWCFWYRYRNIY